MQPVTFKLVIDRTYLGLMSKVARELDADGLWELRAPSQRLNKLGYVQVLQKGAATQVVTVTARNTP